MSANSEANQVKLVAGCSRRCNREGRDGHGVGCHWHRADFLSKNISGWFVIKCRIKSDSFLSFLFWLDWIIRVITISLERFKSQVAILLLSLWVGLCKMMALPWVRRWHVHNTNRVRVSSMSSLISINSKLSWVTTSSKNSLNTLTFSTHGFWLLIVSKASIINKELLSLRLNSFATKRSNLPRIAVARLRRTLLVFISGLDAHGQIFLLFLSCCSIKRVLYGLHGLSFLLFLDLIDLVKSLSQHGKNNIEHEKWANNDNQDTENNGHPPDVRIHQIVHNCGPLLQSDHLENRQHGPSKVVKVGHRVENEVLIERIINTCWEAYVLRLFTELISRTHIDTLPIRTAESFIGFSKRPKTRLFIRKFANPASPIHGSLELLDAQNAEQHKDKQHEHHSIQQFVNGASQRRDKLAHFGEGLDGSEWS